MLQFVDTSFSVYGSCVLHWQSRHYNYCKIISTIVIKSAETEQTQPEVGK